MGTRLLVKTNWLSLIGFLNHDWGRRPIAADEVANAEAKKSNEKDENTYFDMRFVPEARQIFYLDSKSRDDVAKVFHWQVLQIFIE